MRAWRTTAAHLAGGELSFGLGAVLRVDAEGVLYPKGAEAPWEPTPEQLARMAQFPGRYELVDVVPKVHVDLVVNDPIAALERAVHDLGHSKDPVANRIATAVSDAIKATLARVRAEAEAEAKAAAPAPAKAAKAASKPAPSTEPPNNSDAVPDGEKGSK